MSEANPYGNTQSYNSTSGSDNVHRNSKLIRILSLATKLLALIACVMNVVLSVLVLAEPDINIGLALDEILVMCVYFFFYPYIFTFVPLFVQCFFYSPPLCKHPVKGCSHLPPISDNT